MIASGGAPVRILSFLTGMGRGGMALVARHYALEFEHDGSRAPRPVEKFGIRVKGGTLPCVLATDRLRNKAEMFPASLL